MVPPAHHRHAARWIWNIVWLTLVLGLKPSTSRAAGQANGFNLMNTETPIRLRTIAAVSAVVLSLAAFGCGDRTGNEEYSTPGSSTSSPSSAPASAGTTPGNTGTATNPPASGTTQ